MKGIGKKVRFMISAIMVVCLGMAANCPASSETLRMLVWEGDTPAERQKEFVKLVKEKYGVDLKLEISYVGGNDDFFPAVRDGKADIIGPGYIVPKDERFQLIKHKLVLPVNTDNIPNCKNIISGLQNSEYWSEDGKIYGIPFDRGTYGLAYNTALIKNAPETWNIFWDPKFKGKYALGKDQYEQNVYITALAMGMSRNDLSDYRKLNTPEFQEKLAQLAVNAHSLWEGIDNAEILKGLNIATSWGTALPALKEMGETWKIAKPQEGTVAWVEIFMIGYTLESKPELKRIAEEWIDYTLTDEYQTYVVRGIGAMPVTATVREKLTPEEVEQFGLDDPAHFEKNCILLKPMQKKDRDGFKRLWENALKQRK